MAVALFRISFSISTWANFFCSLRYSATVTVSPFSVNPILPYSFFYRYINDSLMPYSLLISLAVLPCSFSSIICRLNSFVYRFRFITIIPVLLYNLLYFYPYSLSQILYQIQRTFDLIVRFLLGTYFKKELFSVNRGSLLISLHQAYYCQL